MQSHPVQARRSRRREFAEQARLAEQLARYLPDDVFFTALENRPRNAVSGYRQKIRGIRSGLPDAEVIFRDPLLGFAKTVFLELKSERGVATKAQKQVCAKLQSLGVLMLNPGLGAGVGRGDAEVSGGQKTVDAVTGGSIQASGDPAPRSQSTEPRREGHAYLGAVGAAAGADGAGGRARSQTR